MLRVILLGYFGVYRRACKALPTVDIRVQSKIARRGLYPFGVALHKQEVEPEVVRVRNVLEILL